MRALGEEHFQSPCTDAHLLDALALRFHAVPLRVIDDAPPFRNFIVIGVGETDTSPGDQPLDQHLSLCLSSASDGPFVVRRRAALSSLAFE